MLFLLLCTVALKEVLEDEKVEDSSTENQCFGRFEGSVMC